MASIEVICMNPVPPGYMTVRTPNTHNSRVGVDLYRKAPLCQTNILHVYKEVFCGFALERDILYYSHKLPHLLSKRSSRLFKSLFCAEKQV